MGRIVGFPRRRGTAPADISLPEVRREISGMQDDLAFTLNFVNRMVAEGNLEAAAAAIDAQQHALESAVSRIAPRAETPGRIRRRAAVIGLAAVFALASGAFAALAPTPEPKAPGSSPAGDAAERLDRVAVLAPANPSDLAAIISGIELALADLEPEDAADPRTRGALDRLSERLGALAPQAPKSLGDQVRAITRTIQELVRETADPGATGTNEVKPASPDPSLPDGH